MLGGLHLLYCCKLGIDRSGRQWFPSRVLNLQFRTFRDDVRCDVCPSTQRARASRSKMARWLASSSARGHDDLGCDRKSAPPLRSTDARHKRLSVLRKSLWVPLPHKINSSKDVNRLMRPNLCWRTAALIDRNKSEQRMPAFQ